MDKYQTVRFDKNSYSVPRRWAFRPVSVKGYVDRLVVVADGQAIARHDRGYGRREKILDPLHYLVLLEKKPAALDHAPVYRDWQLPAAFAALRQALATRLGPSTGARHYLRVLQLLAGHPVERVERASERSRTRGDRDATAITALVERLAHDGSLSLNDDAVSRNRSDNALSRGRPAVAAPRPDLSRFDR